MTPGKMVVGINLYKHININNLHRIYAPAKLVTGGVIINIEKKVIKK